MELDSFYPTFAIMKEVDLSFCIAYTVEEFAEAFGHIVSGRLQVGSLITSHVGLEGVPDAFTRLADPERDAKIVVVPQAI
jgi:threonine dehydrogenase-like Zn-dependent dehydrogenase